MHGHLKVKYFNSILIETHTLWLTIGPSFFFLWTVSFFIPANLVFIRVIIGQWLESIRTET